MKKQGNLEERCRAVAALLGQAFPQSGRNAGGKPGLGLRRRDLAKGCEKYRVGAWAPESEGCSLRVQVLALFFFFLAAPRGMFFLVP